MSVTKAKHIRYEGITLGTPKCIVGKNFVLTAHYRRSYRGEPETLIVQLPRCQLFTGVYESEGKFYCEILVPTDGIAHDLYFNIASRIEQQVKLSRQFQEVTFLGHLRKADMSQSIIRLKLPQNKSQITTTVYSAAGDITSLKDFVTGNCFVPIVALEYAYVLNNVVGFNLLLKEASVVAQTKE